MSTTYENFHPSAKQLSAVFEVLGAKVRAEHQGGQRDELIERLLGGLAQEAPASPRVEVVGYPTTQKSLPRPKQEVLPVIEGTYRMVD